MSPQRSRLPITGEVLRRLRAALFPSGDPAGAVQYRYDSILLWAACCLAFFGFLRSGEFTSRPGESPAICFSDLSVDSKSNPSTIKIQIRRSKTDQFGQGTSVYVSKTNSVLCPVSALSWYLAQRPTTVLEDSPLFIHQDGSPLTRDQFVRWVKEALRAAGIDSSKYTGHSFRIGAASAAAQAGIPDHLIKALGRWESEAYQLYIRIPPETLAAVSQSLC